MTKSVANGGNTDRISILIVDDHAVVRQGLRSLLGLHQGIEVVGEARDGNEAVEIVGKLLPDVVLMDLLMPGVNGIEAIREIRGISPSTQVIVLTIMDQVEQVVAAIKAGALSYLLKDVSLDALVRAIQDAHLGKPSLHPDIARALMAELTDPRRQQAGIGLTERELEVLRCIARACNNSQIAAELIITEKTVKTHVSNILSKLHLADRTQIAVWAHQHGYGERA